MESLINKLELLLGTSIINICLIAIVTLLVLMLIKKKRKKKGGDDQWLN